jgi:hypothetical protein
VREIGHAHRYLMGTSLCTLHKRPRVQRSPAFPALFFSRVNFLQDLAHSAPRD